MGVIFSHLIAVVVGAVAGIFFYRNNVKDVSPIADKIDGAVKQVKKKK
jgi:hypothetical protein